MALSKSIPTGQIDAGGNPIDATYWQWAQINIQQLPVQSCMITLSGYASLEAFTVAPQSPLMSLQFSFPAQPIPLVDASGNPLTDDALATAEAQNTVIAQFPFDPAYLAANFSSFGVGAQIAAAKMWVTNQAPMVGATVVS